MNIAQVTKILKDEGYPKELFYDDNELREVMTYYGDDYFSIKKELGIWCFYHVTNEREKKIELLGKYNTEEKAAIVFLLNRLDSLYLHKYILLAKRENAFLKKRGSLDIQDLQSAMKNVGIPEEYISYKSKKDNSIYIYEENDGWRTAYIDIKGNVFLKTIVASKSTCISIAFTRGYYLYLLDKLIYKYIEDGVIQKKLDTDDILYYLGSK